MERRQRKPHHFRKWRWFHQIMGCQIPKWLSIAFLRRTLPRSIQRRLELTTQRYLHIRVTNPHQKQFFPSLKKNSNKFTLKKKIFLLKKIIHIHFLTNSSSWDESIKLWNPREDRGSLMTFKEHRYCVYSSIWSPMHATRFASASGDHTIKLWDVNGKGLKVSTYVCKTRGRYVPYVGTMEKC